MDIYDPQTLGIMVFGGFMVISAIGIALVSTFSMKETSYEEALAKQRRELGKMQLSRCDKKKKDKVSDKKIRAKKKDEKPNGKIPEQTSEVALPLAELVSVPLLDGLSPEPAPESSSEPHPAPPMASADIQPDEVVSPSAPLESSSASSSKDKKKKKIAKGEPASAWLSRTASVPAPASAKLCTAQAKSSPAQAPSQAKSSPAQAPSQAKSSPAQAPSQAKSNPVPVPPHAKSAPPQSQAKSSPAQAPSQAKSSPAQAPSQAKSSPAQAPSQAKSAPAPSQAKSIPAQTPSQTKSNPVPIPPHAKSAPPQSQAKSSPAQAQAKSAPATSKSVSAPTKSTAKSTPAPSKLSKSAPVLEAVTKEVPVMAVPPVGSQQTASVATIKPQEPKKKASKKKSEPAVDPVDAPLYLPYRALVSTISSMVFSEGEAQRLIEILSEKAGVIQDTWHMATQKGDPVAMLKKQLDEKERQLAAEQEDAAAAKMRLREVSKELSAEKSKVASVETRLSSQLSKREQEMNALQTRMQASYQDHITQTQGLNAKIVSLQDQLEKGPSAQLTRLQQENSILRDALNQATSLAESKHNTELAKLHQDCSKLTKELADKTESLQAEEHIRRGLESKVSTTEKQLAVLQTSHVEREQALQRRLEEVCEDLRTVQRTNSSLQASAEKAQQESSALSELQVQLGSLEAELRERSGHVDALTVQLDQTQAEKSQLEQQVATINCLLEANQSQKDDNNQENVKELEQLKLSLQERDNQLALLQDQLKKLHMETTSQNTNAEPEKNTNSEDASLVASLQDELKNLKDEMEHLKCKAVDDSAERALLQRSLNERDAQLTSLQDELRAEKDRSQDNNVMAGLSSFQTEAKETLKTLFPQIHIEAEQSNWLQAYTLKAQELLSQSQATQSSTELTELLEKLKDAEESRVSLQAECEQYRSVLSETEGTLKVLQKSVEEEELVWKSKMVDSEEQLRVLREHVMLLEAQLEKQAESVTSASQGDAEEMAQLKQLLADCRSQLDSARQEAQAHKEAIEQVKEQLSEAKKHTQLEQNGPAVSAPSQVYSELSLTTEKLHVEETLRQQLSEEVEQTQRTMSELQTQLNLLKAAEDCTQADAEDVVQLKERLEKEKKLSKDLGQAATKLQQLLRATQEQLTKERDTVRTLQEHLESKGEYVELKEGTSV